MFFSNNSWKKDRCLVVQDFARIHGYPPFISQNSGLVASLLNSGVYLYWKDWKITCLKKKNEKILLQYF